MELAMVKTLQSADHAKPADRGVREALSLKRAAYLLDVHEDTLRRWWKTGKILMIRVGPKLLRVPRSEIARLRADH